MRPSPEVRLVLGPLKAGDVGALVCGGILLGLLGYLAWVAVHLRIDYFDSYESLVDARMLAFQDVGWYGLLRPPLAPVLELPAAIVARLSGSPQIGLAVSHLEAVALLAALLWVSFALFRLYLDRAIAAAATLGLGLNALIIHQGPLAEADIPGALFLTAGLYLYLRAEQSERPARRYVAAGALLGAAMCSRFQLIPVPFLVIGLSELVRVAAASIEARKPVLTVAGLRTKLVALGYLPLLILFLVPVLIYQRAGLASFATAPLLFIVELSQNVHTDRGLHADPIQNYRYLVETAGWPVLALAAAGFVQGVWSRLPGTRVMGVWFLSFFVLQTYLITNKEARYLMPALPPLYFFAGRGMQLVAETVARRQGQLASVTAVVLVGLAIPGWIAFREAAKFTDPIYTSTYEASVSESVVGMAGNRPVHWVGPPYPLHPRDYYFDGDDKYTSIFHYYDHVVYYWTGHPVDGGSAEQIGSRVNNGDVVLLDPEPRVYQTRDVPTLLRPLLVQTARVVFCPADAAALSPGEYWIYASDGRSLGHFTIDGSASAATPTIQMPAGCQRLVRYDQVTSFPAPS